MRNMKKIIALALFTFTVLSLCSCSVFDLAHRTSTPANNNGNYLTQEDVDRIIQGIEENVTVNAGDNINVTINSTDDKNAISASKGLLSTVSVTANFTVTTVVPPSFFYEGYTETTKQTSRGSGIIYSIDKERGDAYIITNYHVVYWNGADTENDISDNIQCFLYGQEYDK